jgi:hypothetical protein
MGPAMQGWKSRVIGDMYASNMHIITVFKRKGPGDSHVQIYNICVYMIIYIYIWLVVWNMALIFPSSWEDDPI